MINRIKNNLKKFLSPVFIIFLILAFAMWYVNELKQKRVADSGAIPVQSVQPVHPAP